MSDSGGSREGAPTEWAMERAARLLCDDPSPTSADFMSLRHEIEVTAIALDAARADGIKAAAEVVGEITARAVRAQGCHCVYPDNPGQGAKCWAHSYVIAVRALLDEEGK